MDERPAITPLSGAARAEATRQAHDPRTAFPKTASPACAVHRTMVRELEEVGKRGDRKLEFEGRLVTCCLLIRLVV